MKKIRSLLVANRSEIAIRVMRAASELGTRTVGIYANEDRFALHRFKVDESNSTHIGAPMPGTIVTVSVKTGQKVKRGDPLVSIEAMKMESVVRAEHDMTIAEVFAKKDQLVNPKDLLLTVTD
ncbi:MAG: biotin/lipoyl-containing protein [Rugosibacter sp.]|nr:biotin/lipoyl-containing protein [Rugosibacter sp.]